jgi:hypothetical protein
MKQWNARLCAAPHHAAAHRITLRSTAPQCGLLHNAAVYRTMMRSTAPRCGPPHYGARRRITVRDAALRCVWSAAIMCSGDEETGPSPQVLQLGFFCSAYGKTGTY